jgi:hypothetical protein
VYALFKSDVRRRQFQACWSFTIRNTFPGVECLQVAPESSAETPFAALQLALNVLNEKRNLQAPQLPAASPVTMRAQRTGKAAVEIYENEAVDEVTKLQRAAAKKRKSPTNQSTLTGKFLPGENFKWPVNFEADSELPFPFENPADKDIALIHADGNGIGQVLMSLRSNAEKLAVNDPFLPLALFREFSLLMAEVTQCAAEEASKKVLLPVIRHHDVVPARPLVLGGDDLTLLCRPDLALPFIKVFCAEFQRQSYKRLTNLKGRLPEGASLPERLTASAGVALIKANQPFMQCHELVESLCKTAKGQGKKNLGKNQVAPPMVSFHRVAATMINDVDVIREHEWQIDPQRIISLQAYCLEPCDHLPELAQLESMHALFDGEQGRALTINRLREVAALLKESPQQAIKTYRRWLEISVKEPARAERVTHFKELMAALTQGEPDTELPFALAAVADAANDSVSREQWISPLADLLTLKYLQPVSPPSDSATSDMEVAYG